MFQRDYYVANCKRLAQFIAECPAVPADLISLISSSEDKVSSFLKESGLKEHCSIGSLNPDTGSGSADSDFPDFTLIANSSSYSRIFHELERAMRDYLAPDGLLPLGLTRGQQEHGERADGLYVQDPNPPSGRRLVFASDLPQSELAPLAVFLPLSKHVQCVWMICHLDSLDAVVRCAWAALAVCRAEHRAMRTICLLLLPGTDLSSDQMANLCTIRICSLDQKSLPIRAAYDDIEHFVEFGWPAYWSKQRQAVKFLASVIGGKAIEHVVDMGCGSGELMLGLAQEYKQIRFRGIDSSSKQIHRAEENNLAPDFHSARTQFEHLPFDECMLSRGEDQRGTMLLFTGNVLPHIGALAFRKWLKEHSDNPPRYICFDFAVNWRDVLGKSSFATACGPITSNSVNSLQILSHMSTTSGPRFVDRGLIMQLFDHSSEHQPRYLGSQAIFTHQHAEVPDTYFGVLENQGYTTEALGRYESGWGQHDCYLAEYQGREGVPDWPALSQEPGNTLNTTWYEVLGEMWREVNQATGSIFHDVSFFPAAILPFNKHSAWARYIPRTDDDKNKSYSRIFKAWMELVDRHTIDSKYPPEGSAKGESLPPYAPSLYDAVLGDVPASFVRPISDQALRLALNERDELLADLEKSWLQQGQKIGFFVIPIYLMGVPAFCLVAQGLPTNTPPSVVMTVLRHERAQLQVPLERVFNEWGWRQFVERSYNKLKEWTAIEQMLQVVALKEWKSWLDTVPGMSIHAEPTIAASWVQMNKFHEAIIRELREGTAHQISNVLMDQQFFIGVSEGGCGHERITARHRNACTALLKEFARLPKSPLQKHAASVVAKWSTEVVPLPQNDDGIWQSDSRYDSINFDFQSFKSLFCRSDINRGRMYRLSPLMLYASRQVYALNLASQIVLGGQFDVVSFDDALQVRPKMSSESTWEYCKAIWEFLNRVSPKRVEIRGDQADRGEISVAVEFTKVAEYSHIAGRGLSTLLDGLGDILEKTQRAPGRVRGFSIIFDCNAVHDIQGARLIWDKGSNYSK